ncbi:autotransporter outer membrane beta-barrel domain-containing protein [Erwinia typographi]|uniref:autotransporter outer membrane beta-barrel domain-containing protein n=1 Tax=Erwinia typographi TaxID=371042 RepID=UPI00068B3B34|nr:autotransporter outer membrane beta-barrel domain-containing protein [Erwinia typographi]
MRNRMKIRVYLFAAGALTLMHPPLSMAGEDIEIDNGETVTVSQGDEANAYWIYDGTLVLNDGSVAGYTDTTNKAGLNAKAESGQEATLTASGGDLGITINNAVAVGTGDLNHHDAAGINTVTLNRVTLNGLLQISESGSDPSRSTVTVTDSTLRGQTAGALNERGNLTLSRVQATGTDGPGVISTGGTTAILNGSVITGEAGAGIAMGTDFFANPSAAGELVIDNSSVTGQNGSALSVVDGYTATIHVQNGATLTGSDGDILSVNDGGTADLTVSNAALTGNISTAEGGTTHLTLSDRSSLTGTLVNVADATLDSTSLLTLNGASTVSTLDNAGTVVMTSGSSLAGNVSNTGTLTLSDESAATATLTGGVSNSGSIVLNPTSHSAGNTLTIDGNYTGLEGSSVSLGTVLGGDDSLTDRLVITGSTAGSSSLSIANENGAGAQTLEGIKVIDVGGSSDGTFTLANRVVAGAYDYSLQKGSASGADAGDWYLTSLLNNPDPDNPDVPDDHAVRPEAGSYIANLQAARTLFNLSLHDREGETRYTDPVSGETRTTTMWMRNEGGRNKSRLSDGQNSSTANRYVLQIGGDLLSRETQGDGKMTLGVMGGYAEQSSSTHNSATGNRSKGDVHGYSAGLYGTWYQNPADQSGLYVDSWLQYGWFDSEVKGDDLSPEKYKSKGLSASLEAGYGLKVATLTSSRGMENSVWLQPHAQVIWTGMKADGHTESNGTRVEGSGNDNVQTKLGLRAFLNGKSVKDKETVREFQPFVEANWIYNTQTTGVRMNGDGDTVSGTRNAGEVKAGVEGRLSQGLSVWTAVAQQVGDKGYHDTAGSLGVRYRF